MSRFETSGYLEVGSAVGGFWTKPNRGKKAKNVGEKMAANEDVEAEDLGFSWFRFSGSWVHVFRWVPHGIMDRCSIEQA